MYKAEVQAHSHTSHCLFKMEERNRELRQEVQEYVVGKVNPLLRKYRPSWDTEYDIHEQVRVFRFDLIPLSAGFFMADNEHFQLGSGGLEFVRSQLSRILAKALVDDWDKRGLFTSTR
jgi:hypothetical protein